MSADGHLNQAAGVGASGDTVDALAQLARPKNAFS